MKLVFIASGAGAARLLELGVVADEPDGNRRFRDGPRARRGTGAHGATCTCATRDRTRIFLRGLYAAMLRPYFDLFSRDQILCLKFGDIIGHTPEDLASRLHTFIGVTPRPDDTLGLDVK